MESIEINYFHLKRNPIVINALISECDTTNFLNMPNPIRITECNNNITLTLILNLYCTPCKNEFEKIEDLLTQTKENGPNVQVLLYCYNEELDDNMTKTTLHLIALAEKLDPNQLRMAIHDWYITFDYIEWSKKYPVIIKPVHVSTLNKFRKWFIDNQIKGTPTTYFNSNLISGTINIADLIYMFN